MLTETLWLHPREPQTDRGVHDIKQMQTPNRFYFRLVQGNKEISFSAQGVYKMIGFRFFSVQMDAIIETMN